MIKQHDENNTIFADWVSRVLERYTKKPVTMVNKIKIVLFFVFVCLFFWFIIDGPSDYKFSHLIIIIVIALAMFWWLFEKVKNKR